ncbi:hypothetical protein GCM10029992_26020 [Glycomyces albus]
MSRDTYAGIVRAEIRAAAARFDQVPRVDTVFFGGGTPTLLSAADLSSILADIDVHFGLAPDAEVTTEANPESVDADYLAELHDGGFNRLSIGMQSTAEHVLRVLDREHSPAKALDAVEHARKAGFEHVSLDLIYGTPGETADDFAASLAAAVASGVDHVSAYALIVEDGTQLARRIRSGQVPRPPTTSPPTATWPPSELSPKRDSPGTRSRTGPPHPKRAAATTSCTGPAATGGAPGPAPTPTCPAFAGGTTSTLHLRRGPRRGPAGRRTRGPHRRRAVP